jgi:hypothetical protein
MDCYSERAHLLAILARDHVAYLYTDPDEEAGYQHVLAIDIDNRWLTWHLADADLHLFPNVAPISLSLWDGHTTNDKYAYIARFVRGEGAS